MGSLEFITCLILISISAYLACSEIALFSLSRFQLRTLKEHFRPSHRKIKRLLSDPGGILISILVTSEVVNVALSSLIAAAISRSEIHLPPSFPTVPSWILETILGIAITTPIILFFCEITPKVIGARINQIVAPLTVGPLTFVYEIFKPIRLGLKYVIRWITPRHSQTSEDAKDVLRESDFLLMVEEGHKEGAIQEGELDLIRNVFQLDNTTVAEVATPLSQVLSLPSHTTAKGALNVIRSQRYSRIPITGPNKKEIAGILYSKDLIRGKLQYDPSSHTGTTGNTVTVASLMRKPFFVNPTMRLNALFRKFKEHKIHMAIVKNHQGDVVGVVTMSDILDTLFEDFFGREDNDD